MRTFSILLSCMFLIGCAGGNVETPVSPAAEGVVSINFDDGFESAFVNGMPIIDAAGLKTTQFIPKFDVICAHYILHFLSRRLSTARRICSCLLVSVISRPSLNPLFGSCRYTRYKPSSSWSAS